MIRLNAKMKKHIETVGYYAAHANTEKGKVTKFVNENIDNTQVQSMVESTMVAVANGTIDAQTAIRDIEAIDLVIFPLPPVKPEKPAKAE